MAKTKHVATIKGHRAPDNPELESLLQERCRELAATGQAPSDIMDMAIMLDDRVKQLGLHGALELLTKLGIQLSRVEQDKYAGLLGRDGR